MKETEATDMRKQWEWCSRVMVAHPMTTAYVCGWGFVIAVAEVWGR